ncbi:DUF5004 domain-containing protein [Mesonia sp.]|uniref:DUF5004 domain-containing protein n=1 Tax=Mesonia sp. TaxID=1960830 RepID=UPI0025C0BC98|nr:DUF5004 domain-containing protein [Mesonia sp.]
MKKHFFKLLFAIVLVFAGACSPTQDDEIDFSEPEKDITGSWELNQVLRNGEDITSLVDFTQFRINFLEDGTYNFENYIPFAVKEPGIFYLDDPQFAFQINFQTSSETVPVEFTYPIVDGKRQLQLKLSPGCNQNKYVYTLNRIED